MYGLTLLAAIALCTYVTGPPLGRARRRLGPDLPLRGLGRRRRDRRRAPLPRRHELGRGAGRVVGPVRDLEGRARRVGRHRRRLPRRRHRRQAGRRGRLAPRRLPRARAPARAGPRPSRELVEPGALREADRPALGPRDRSDPPAARAHRAGDVPPDVPLRADLGLRGRGDPRLRDRAAVPPASAGALRRVHRALLRRPVRDGAAPDRSRARDPRASPQRLGVARRDRRRRDVVRALAAARAARRGPKPSKPVVPKRRMAVPGGRVRPRG